MYKEGFGRRLTGKQKNNQRGNLLLQWDTVSQLLPTWHQNGAESEIKHFNEFKYATN